MNVILVFGIFVQFCLLHIEIISTGKGFVIHHKKNHINFVKNVFLNTWAVVVHGDEKMAQRVATENGFVNKGRLFGNVYEFVHRGIPRRRKRAAFTKTMHLNTDIRVLWATQQEAKTRKKRSIHFNDEKWKSQWYLHRTEVGYKGHDMNVLPVWEKGLTGKGIVISVLDDGLENTHDEIKSNYDKKASFDYISNDTDPLPKETWRNENNHGTRCAAVVAAVANNSKCIVGVAFGASIGGIRMLDGEVTDIVEARSLRHARDHVDIYSSSWGPDDQGAIVEGPGPLAKQALKEGAQWGRHGKGSIFVWASGNGGANDDNCNCDGYTNSIYTISVSATTSNGTQPWYSESCASTLVSAYSGGISKSDGKIVTADLRNGCTDEHTGTSVSPPLIAGFVALALEANPNLSWRDVQHLLVETSSLDKLKGEDFRLNGAKKRYSHHFGFGVVNGAKLIDLAERWPTITEQKQCRRREKIPGFPNNRFNKSSPLIVRINTTACTGADQNVKYAEHVLLVTTFNHSRRGATEILIVSPMRTRSWVLQDREKDINAGWFNSWQFLSTHFWGEDPRGIWEIMFFSKDRDEYGQGFLNEPVTLIIYGTEHKPGQRKNGDPTTPPYKCHVECKMGCSGPGNDQCAKCQRYTYFDVKTKKKICLASCPKTKFADNNTLACLQCHSSCRTCSRHNISHCTSCAVSHTLNDGDCVRTCPTRMFKSLDAKGSFVCSYCSERCAACYGTSGNCTACNYSSTLKRGSCYEKCASNEWLDGDLCRACHPSCRSCNGEGENKCTSCPKKQLNDVEDRYLYEGTRCLKECPLGTYYENTIKQNCMNCPQNCLRCSNDGRKCDVCDVRFYRVSSGDGKCDERCPIGYYTNKIERTCEACGLECASCVPGNPLACTSCLKDFYLKDSECVSASECNTYYYVNKTSGKCSPCPPKCLICKTADVCKSCFVNYFLTVNKKCVSVCPNGTFAPDSSDRCEFCHSECASCDGPYVHDCTACHKGMYLHNGKCVKDVPTGYYVDETLTCKRCHHTCAACVGPGPKDCRTCKDGLDKRTGGGCVNPCPDQYLSENSCKNCDPSCKSCVGPTARECLECHNNESLNVDTRTCNKACHRKFYANDKTFICQSCHKSCATCSGPGDNQCLTCPDKLHFHNNTCLLQCPAGWYKTFDRKCSPCSTRCKTCLYGYDLCTHCKAEFVWRDFKCYTECAARMFRHSSNRCYSCDDSCLTCAGTAPNECTSCEEGMTLHNGMCVRGCLPGFYMSNKNCYPCGENCLSCTERASRTPACTVCANYTVLLPNGVCAETCPVSTYQSPLDNRCIPCQGIGCKSCSHSSTCSACLPFYELSNGVCKSTCGLDMYPDLNTKHCRECHPFCLSCNGPTKADCKRCSKKAVMVITKKNKKQCLPSCPLGLYSLNQLCVPCKKSCKSCVNKEMCTSCKNNTVLYEKRCLTACPNGWYQGSRKNCVKCSDKYENCAKCNATLCTECIPSAYRLHETCVTHCNASYFRTSRKCLPCTTAFRHCASCNESACLTCQDGFHYINNSCAPACGDCLFNASCVPCSKKSVRVEGPTVSTVTVLQKTYVGNHNASNISVRVVQRSRRSIDEDSEIYPSSAKFFKLSLAVVAIGLVGLIGILLWRSKNMYQRRRFLTKSIDSPSLAWKKPEKKLLQANLALIK